MGRLSGVVRRRPGWVWGGAALIVTSAVGGVGVVSAAGDRQSVWTVARDLPAGHVLTAGDVREVEVAADAGVVAVEGDEPVVGRIAAVPLVEGSLLAPKQVAGEAKYPPPGQAEVSFAVEEGDAPEVEAGQWAAVYPGGQSVEPAPAEPEDGVVPVVGVVTGVRETPEPGGGPRVVSLLIESAAAERAARVERPRLVVLEARRGGGA